MQQPASTGASISPQQTTLLSLEILAWYVDV